MARVTYVKKAQQRYVTVPVMDEFGQQKTTPVMRKDGVTPKTDKRGRAIVRRTTVEDKNQPLPNRTCDKCDKEITVGSPYKWIAPKSGPYGGRKLYRCGDCPVWQVWEYSSSFSATLARLQHDMDETLMGAELATEDDASTLASDLAEMVRELATEKEESADNIEEGFGHSTYMSDELRETAQSLNDWADEIEQSYDGATFPEPESEDCDDCEGTGDVQCDSCSDGETVCPTCEDDGSLEDGTECPDCEGGTNRPTCNNCSGNGTVDCETCGGNGSIDSEDPSEEALDAWAEEVRDLISGALGNCPV